MHCNIAVHNMLQVVFHHLVAICSIHFNFVAPNTMEQYCNMLCWNVACAWPGLKKWMYYMYIQWFSHRVSAEVFPPHPLITYCQHVYTCCVPLQRAMYMYCLWSAVLNFCAQIHVTTNRMPVVLISMEWFKLNLACLLHCRLSIK